MGRFSPTVLPRAFDFGGILERALQGYRYGRGLRREREEERGRKDDRKRREDALRSFHLSQPGAARFEEYIERLTPESVQRAGQAGEPEVDFKYRQPAPTEVTLPGGRKTSFQERAPYLTETGVVIDPQRARQERGLAAYMDASMLREPVKKPWEREGFETEPEYLGYLGRKRKAEPPREARPPITLNQAIDAVRALYGKEDPNTGVWTYPPGWGPDKIGEIARGLVGGEGFPAVPPIPVAPPIGARPPGDDRGSGIGRFFRGLGDIFRGRRGGADTEAGTKPGAVAPVSAPEPTDELPQPRLLEELDLGAEQQAKYEQLLEQGWAHDDAVDDLAADEWDALVQGGVDPTEATRQVAQKYGRSGAQ